MKIFKMKHQESKLQINCVRWFRLQYPNLAKLLFSVPNGGHRSATEARIMQAEGIISGVSDLILLIPNQYYSSLCIEMKFGKGKQTENQIEWQKVAENAGNKYVICNSVDTFIHEIENYMSHLKKF